jgi:hypothetical protein
MEQKTHLPTLYLDIMNPKAVCCVTSKNPPNGNIAHVMIIINKPILTLPYSIKGLCLGKYLYKLKKRKLYDNLTLGKRTPF